MMHGLTDQLLLKLILLGLSMHSGGPNVKLMTPVVMALSLDRELKAHECAAPLVHQQCPSRCLKKTNLRSVYTALPPEASPGMLHLILACLGFRTSRVAVVVVVVAVTCKGGERSDCAK